MARPSKYNWADIKKHYEAGYNQKDITDKFGCPKSSLSEKIKKDGWEINEQAINLNKGIIEVSEQKSSLMDKDVRLTQIVEDKADSELRRRNLIFNTTEKILQASSNLLEKNTKQVVVKVKEYSRESGSSESLDTIEQELDPQDLKNLADTVDKASVTLGVNQRHANSQVQITNTNAQQNNIEIEWD